LVLKDRDDFTFNDSLIMCVTIQETITWKPWNLYLYNSTKCVEWNLNHVKNSATVLILHLNSEGNCTLW
jgi:hypothetical protein